MYFYSRRNVYLSRLDELPRRVGLFRLGRWCETKRWKLWAPMLLATPMLGVILSLSATRPSPHAFGFFQISRKACCDSGVGRRFDWRLSNECPHAWRKGDSSRTQILNNKPMRPPLGESVGALECIFINAAMCAYHDLTSHAIALISLGVRTWHTS